MTMENGGCGGWRQLIHVVSTWKDFASNQRFKHQVSKQRRDVMDRCRAKLS